MNTGELAQALFWLALALLALWAASKDIRKRR
jgi:hypothetical protein